MPTVPASWLPALLAAGATDTTPTQRRAGDRTRKRPEVAGEEIVDQKRNKSTPVACDNMPRVRIVATVQIRTESEANAGGKLRDKIRRKAAVKDAVRAALPRLVSPLALPVVVTLTRIGTGTRPLDDDNLRRALKTVRDVVAAWLEVDDADKRVKWRYRERRGYQPAVVIDVRQTGG